MVGKDKYLIVVSSLNLADSRQCTKKHLLLAWLMISLSLCIS